MVEVEAVLPSGQLANSCGSSPLHESDPPKNAPGNTVLVNTYPQSTTENERKDDCPSCMLQDKIISLQVSVAVRQYIIFAKYRHPSQGYLR